MAVLFNESTDYLSLGGSGHDVAADTDWSIGIWTRVTDNTGSGFQYLVSTGGFNDDGDYNLYIREDSSSGAGSWVFGYNTVGSGLAENLTSSSSPGADGKWRLIVITVVDDGLNGTARMYFCEPGGSASLEDSLQTSAGDQGFTNGVYEIGRRSDGNADRYYGSEACEFFHLEGHALSTDEIEALANGLTILDLGYHPEIYIPMEQNVATFKDIGTSGSDGTRNGTLTTVEHAPVIGTFEPAYVNLSAAAGGGVSVEGATASIEISGEQPATVIGVAPLASAASLVIAGQSAIIQAGVNVTIAPILTVTQRNAISGLLIR